MGMFADSLFAALMSWVRALVNSLWALFTSERTTMLEFLGKNWLMIVVVLIAAGLLMDWVIWMIRWRPYTLWAQRMRRILRIAPVKEEEESLADASAIINASAQDELYEEEALPEGYEDDEDWLPEQPVFNETDEQQALERAQAVPDEELGVYPGMRYDEQARAVQEEMGGTRRFGAVHQEGPGAAEVNRRREEIDAYRRQMEEEARRERERRLEEMRRAEEERLAEEARRAEETRRAQEARAAQEEYERQLAEYERQKAQYEKELAQYQRDLAAYEAAMQERNADVETSEEIEPAKPKSSRTRVRRRPSTYSDMVEGEMVETLPETPQWPQMDKTMSEVKKSAAQKKPEKKNGIVTRVAAHLVEQDTNEIPGVGALPPRVNPQDAYKPAVKPEENRRRS